MGFGCHYFFYKLICQVEGIPKIKIRIVFGGITQHRKCLPVAEMYVLNPETVNFLKGFLVLLDEFYQNFMYKQYFDFSFSRIYFQFIFDLKLQQALKSSSKNTPSDFSDFSHLSAANCRLTSIFIRCIRI